MPGRPDRGRELAVLKGRSWPVAPRTRREPLRLHHGRAGVAVAPLPNDSSARILGRVRGCAVDRQRAVAIVEVLLTTELAIPGVELAVSDVEEHDLGWLVFWQTAAWVRTQRFQDTLVGHGPCLVDALDGSVHSIPATTFIHGGWEEQYLVHVRGVLPPDPLLDAVRVCCSGPAGRLPATSIRLPGRPSAGSRPRRGSTAGRPRRWSRLPCRTAGSCGSRVSSR